jgi:hypothetical protein
MGSFDLVRNSLKRTGSCQTASALLASNKKCARVSYSPFTRFPKADIKSDFLSVQEERDLLALVQTLSFYEFKLHGVGAKRRVLHFSLRYALESRVLSSAPEIRSQFEPIRRRAAAVAGIVREEFSQILVNAYRPGAGIGCHHDLRAFGIVAGTLRKQSSDND